MFNVLSPGFRVKPQDDVPGFNIDENGLPRRERTWSDGMQPGSAMPVTPVNCTTVNGTLGCTSPGGITFGDNVKASRGFPSPLDPGVSDYHRYDVPDGPYDDSARTMRQYLINYPTPGPRNMVRPATPEGTLNEATPELVYDVLTAAMRAGPFRFPSTRPYGSLISPVRSYLTTDQNGNQIVVNVTEPSHLLHPGYVVRYVTPSDKGPIIQNEGEGSARPQGPFAQSVGLLDAFNYFAWQRAYQEHLDRSRP